MGDANKIRVGQVLNIPEPTPGAPRPVAPAAVTAPAGGSVHTVASGETIGGIAHKYGLKTGDVLRANGLTEESAKKIKVGQKIKIPAKTAANTYKAPDKSTARIDPAPSAPAAVTAPAIRPVSVTAPAPAPAPAIRTPVVHPVAPAATATPSAPAPAAVTVPAVQTPAVTVPAVTVPAVQTPAVPAVSVPAVQTPTVSVAAPAAGAVRDYVVQAGDDLTTIAKSHNMSKTDLILLNGFSLDAEVTPGQTIKVK